MHASTFFERGFEQLETVKEFLNEMNVISKSLGLKESNWASPHGLSNWNNKTTALEMAKLSFYSLKNPLFREIVKTKSFFCRATRDNPDGGDEPVKSTDYIWENSNKLLGTNGCTGLKTGITPASGPCLASTVTYEG